MTNYFAAIDGGNITGAVYGFGASRDAALRMARDGGADGKLQVVECSDLAAAWVEENGGAPHRELLVGPEGVIRRGESESEIEIGTRELTDLRREAAEAGDLEQVRICDAALDGDTEAAKKCDQVIRDALAQED